MSDSKLVDVDLHLHRVTDRAILVSENGREEKAVWLPLSLIEWECVSQVDPRSISVTMPEWLATNEGLL